MTLSVVRFYFCVCILCGRFCKEETVDEKKVPQRSDNTRRELNHMRYIPITIPVEPFHKKEIDI